MFVNCIGYKNVIIIFSFFFLIGNLFYRNIKRRGWVLVEEFVVVLFVIVGVREFRVEFVGWGRGDRELAFFKVMFSGI